ncbi:MAG: hypothetical protein JW940_26305 [Polyangiaceae bacterium]|nr:hypothetical protein [Polyangiaceae bacterium]
MPDPICSATPSPIPTHQDPECVDPLLGGSSSASSQAQSEAAQGVCRPAQASTPAPPRAETADHGPAVKALVASQSRPTSAAAFVQNQRQNANTHAERMAQSPERTFKHEAGITADGSRYETAGLLYGHDPATGLTGELGVLAAQKGWQDELQVTGMRSGIQSQSGDSLSAEGLTLHAGSGIHNKDGSTGYNASVGGTLVGAEGTANVGGSSLTLGASLGTTLEGSVGTRDSDHDGNTEYCVRVAVPVFPINAGACVEIPENLRR